MMVRYGSLARKWDHRRIIEKLKEKGSMGYNELFKEMDFDSKGTFNNRIKGMMKKGLIDKESAPPDTRSRVIVKLSPKATNPRYSTLRMLELSAGPHSSMNADEVKDILTKEVSQTLIEISSFVFRSKEEGFVVSDFVKEPVYDAFSEEVSSPAGEPLKTDIDEITFLKGLTRYGIEIECFRHPADYIYTYDLDEELLWEKMVENRHDTHYFPALGTISNKESASEMKENLDKLHEWIQPLRNRSEGLAFSYLSQETRDHLNHINALLKNLAKDSETKGGEKSK